MRRSQRLIATAVVIALSGVLAGCSGGMSSFDPTDMLDFLDTKKKLPGERKPVFPGGVPGLEQGVPKELYKGAQQQPDQNAPPPVAETAPPPEPTKGKKSKGRTAARQAPNPAAEPTAAEPDAAASEEGAPAALPAEPKAKKMARRRTTTPSADQAAQPPAAPAQTTQQSAAPFPAPLPSGGFSR